MPKLTARGLPSGWRDRSRRRLVAQGSLAALALAAIFIAEDAVTNTAIVAALGSTAFVVFVLPHSRAATPRRILGGHLVGLAVGSGCAALLASPTLHTLQLEHRYILDAMAALSVALSILVMVLVRAEHPPAAGTALGLTAQSWSRDAILFVLVGAVLLTAVRVLLQPWLRDLA